MEAKLSARLQLLELTREKTKDVAVSDNLEKIRRHKEALQTIVAGVEEFKRDIEQEKLEKRETVDKVKEAKVGLLCFWFRFALFSFRKVQ